MDKVWMQPPFGVGEPKEVDATTAVLTPSRWLEPVRPATRH